MAGRSLLDSREDSSISFEESRSRIALGNAAEVGGFSADVGIGGEEEEEEDDHNYDEEEEEEEEEGEGHSNLRGSAERGQRGQEHLMGGASSRQVTLGHAGHFFGPQGVLGRSMQQSQPAVDRTTWGLQSGLGAMTSARGLWGPGSQGQRTGPGFGQRRVDSDDSDLGSTPPPRNSPARVRLQQQQEQQQQQQQPAYQRQLQQLRSPIATAAQQQV